MASLPCAAMIRASPTVQEPVIETRSLFIVCLSALTLALPGTAFGQDSSQSPDAEASPPAEASPEVSAEDAQAPVASPEEAEPKADEESPQSAPDETAEDAPVNQAPLSTPTPVPSTPKAEAPDADSVVVVPTVGDRVHHTSESPQKADGLKIEKSVSEQRKEFLDLGDVQWVYSPEYRVRTIGINPLELNGTTVRDVHWTEQRFRLDTTVAKVGVGAIRFQADFLDGVLFGDNGAYGGTPSSNNGVTLTSNRPNVTRWEIGLPDGADPLARESYVPVLREADLMQINYLYADVFLPAGLLRIGRQPRKYGAGIPSHDGGPYNRWGVSQHSDGVDRALFGTKLDEAFYTLLYGYKHVVDPSMDNGLIFALFYDWLVQDQLYLNDDDLTSFGGALEFRRKKTDWFGWDWSDVLLSAAVVYLTNDEFSTNIIGMPASMKGTVEDLSLTLNYMLIAGKSREVSEGFAALAGTQPEIQDIRSHGLQAIIDYNLDPVTLTMEFDMATGDDDPRVTTDLTQFNFARDMNVGLLLFEHVMAFETARSAAVGIENLAGLDSASFPLTEVNSEGRFTNAIALFPQMKIDLVKTEDHAFHTRIGGLFAWSAAENGVVDPIMTSLSEDGKEITDDAVNFNGGRPARFYGTELDLQLGWNYKHYFTWTLEGAVLFPGAALYDEHGDAVNSFMVENRFEFRF